MRVRGLALAGLAVSGALTLPGSAGAAVSSSTQIPRPGLISATVFKLVFRLHRDGAAPHELVVGPLGRHRLPRGIAVVGTAQLLVDSPRGTATYAGMVAAYSSRTVRSASSPRPGDAVRWEVTGEPASFEALLSDASIEYVEAPVGRWTALDAPPTVDFQSVPSALSGNDIFNDGHAVSWSAERAPAESSDTDAAAGSTTESLIDGQLNSELVGDIELALDARFPGEFPAGSLDGDPTLP